MASPYQGGLEGLSTEIINHCFSYLMSSHQAKQPPPPPPPGSSYFPGPSREARNYVKNFRLVSKKCNELISPLLVNSIRVFLTSESLLRLETFAKNTAISKGV